MKLTSLDLEEFRGYCNLHIEIDPAGLRLFGANASGKSSLLEAVAMLATTRSPRTSVERDVIAWESGEQYGVAPYMRLHAAVESRSGAFGVAMTVEAAADRGGKLRKQIRLDGRQVRAADAVGRLKAVLFSVEDVALVSGAPLGRRRYLDLTISQVDGRYLRTLSSLNRVLAQRNSLLKSFARERIQPRDSSAIAQLTFWDEQLVGPAAYLVTARLLSTARLTELIAHRSANLMDGAAIEFRYIPKMAVPEFMVGEHAATTRQRVGAALTEQLRAVRVDEFRRGLTLVGPHRDDFVFAIDGRELSLYGSRGQQRLGILAYKLSEGDLIAEMTGERPILLLDDVLSELDSVHRDLILRGVKANNCQLLVTSTDAMLLDHPALHHLPLMVAENGDIGLA